MPEVCAFEREKQHLRRHTSSLTDEVPAFSLQAMHSFFLKPSDSLDLCPALSPSLILPPRPFERLRAHLPLSLLLAGVLLTVSKAL